MLQLIQNFKDEMIIESKWNYLKHIKLILVLIL